MGAARGRAGLGQVGAERERAGNARVQQDVETGREAPHVDLLRMADRLARFMPSVLA